MLVQLDSPIVSATAMYQQVLIFPYPSSNFIRFQCKELLQCSLHQVLHGPHLLHQFLLVVTSGGHNEGGKEEWSPSNCELIPCYQSIYTPNHCTSCPKLFLSMPSCVCYFWSVSSHVNPSLSPSHVIYSGLFPCDLFLSGFSCWLRTVNI